jgi:archaellum component FlaG (FlaF/FlaG flagellin family)
MTRYSKAFGFGLVAVFAMIAVMASSATATSPTFTASKYPVHLVSDDVEPEDAFTQSGSEVTCSEESYTSHSLTGPTKAITVTPTYYKCHTENGTPVTVTLNGCDFKFTVAKNMATDHDQGTVDLICPDTKNIEIHHYPSHSNHAIGSTSCTTTIFVGEYGPVTYTSTTSTSDVLVEGEIPLSAQTHGACSFGLTVNGTVTYDASIKIRDKGGVRLHVG